MIILPKEAYYEKSFFDLEREHIFNKNWQFAGFVEDVSEAGDFITAQVGAYNLVAVRGRDHRLRAFHNLCRHRGTQLLRTTGKACKALTCPYHDWTYSLNGELMSVPEKQQEFPELDQSKFSLHRASVETWLGMVFVHPDPKAPSLMHWLEGVQGWIGPHRPEELVEYKDGATEHVIEANWKIVAENYIDGYHLAHLHSETLSMYDHQKQETGFIGPHFYFYEPLAPDYAANVKKAAPAPLIDHFTEEQPMGGYVPLLFPNLGITAAESSWSIFHIEPVSPSRSIVRTRTRLMPASDWEYSRALSRSWSYFGDGAAKYEGDPETDPMASGDFMKEDVYACEQQQKSLVSPLFSVGATAQRLEASVLGFQRNIASRIPNFEEV